MPEASERKAGEIFELSPPTRTLDVMTPPVRRRDGEQVNIFPASIFLSPMKMQTKLEVAVTRPMT